MPLVRFTRNIQRHVTCPDRRVNGATAREALDAYFDGDRAKARLYVLDERGALRPHMAIFINGRPLRDREHLTDAIEPDDTIDVFQALSGG
jgi:hypothetical protein